LSWGAARGAAGTQQRRSNGRSAAAPVPVRCARSGGSSRSALPLLARRITTPVMCGCCSGQGERVSPTNHGKGTPAAAATRHAVHTRAARALVHVHIAVGDGHTLRYRRTAIAGASATGPARPRQPASWAAEAAVCVCVCVSGWLVAGCYIRRTRTLPRSRRNSARRENIAAGCCCWLLLRTAHGARRTAGGREAPLSCCVLLRRRAAELLSVLHTCVRPLLPCLLRDGIR
jgi:hypothetical protein